MRIGSNSCWDFVKDNIAFFLHLSFSWTLLCGDRFITLSVILWALLSFPPRNRFGDYRRFRIVYIFP